MKVIVFFNKKVMVIILYIILFNSECTFSFTHMLFSDLKKFNRIL